MAKKETTSELREEMLKTLGVSENMSPEYDRVINWIDNLMDGLQMAKELADPDIPIEVIVKEFFRDDMPDKERQEVIKTMTDIRREYINLKTKK